MNKKFIDGEEAVSPIIGTILMVAITVIMAAIISSWSAGIKAPETPKSVGLDVSRLSEKNVTITITSIDPPQTVLTRLTATFKNGTNVNVKKYILGSGAPSATGWIASTSTFSGEVKTNYANETYVASPPTNATVGDSSTLFINGFSEFMVITAEYGDGTVKAIYSQKV
ncbi:MAG: type IV pilin N-terminal domain-containing protein [Candidatus Methanoperedens sp.]|nr:type IV pilin N-terminal domain-containing protein [Candidatus Methanoperedens sp.]